jgi:hypothetical protein
MPCWHTYRFAWIAQRLASSNSPTRCASAACRHHAPHTHRKHSWQSITRPLTGTQVVRTIRVMMCVGLDDPLCAAVCLGHPLPRRRTSCSAKMALACQRYSLAISSCCTSRTCRPIGRGDTETARHTHKDDDDHHYTPGHTSGCRAKYHMHAGWQTNTRSRGNLQLPGGSLTSTPRIGMRGRDRWPMATTEGPTSGQGPKHPPGARRAASESAGPKTSGTFESP